MTVQYDVVDQRFTDLTLQNVQLQTLSTGHMWVEGPVWVPGHNCLYFSDIPNQRIHRWSPDGSVSLLREGSDFANGNTLDNQGRLVTCIHGSRSVCRTNFDGSIETLASTYNGKRLNSPNDVVVKRDGSIWFTDPTYGILTNYEGNRATPEQDNRNVFRLDADTGDLAPVCSDISQPNGLAFSPDEGVLYVADSSGSHDPSADATIYAFDVKDDLTLANKRAFYTVSPGLPDGIRVDSQGNVWTSSADSVQCIAPDGNLLGRILVPEVVSNLEFGGPRNTHLFITATTTLYAIHVNAERAGT